MTDGQLAAYERRYHEGRFRREDLERLLGEIRRLRVAHASERRQRISLQHGYGPRPASPSSD